MWLWDLRALFIIILCFYLEIVGRCYFVTKVHVSLVTNSCPLPVVYFASSQQALFCPSHFSIPFRQVSLASLAKSSEEWRLRNVPVLPLFRACYIYGLFLFRSENCQELGIHDHRTGLKQLFCVSANLFRVVRTLKGKREVSNPRAI